MSSASRRVSATFILGCGSISQTRAFAALPGIFVQSRRTAAHPQRPGARSVPPYGTSRSGLGDALAIIGVGGERRRNENRKQQEQAKQLQSKLLRRADLYLMDCAPR